MHDRDRMAGVARARTHSSTSSGEATLRHGPAGQSERGAPTGCLCAQARCSAYEQARAICAFSPLSPRGCALGNRAAPQVPCSSHTDARIRVRARVHVLARLRARALALGILPPCCAATNKIRPWVSSVRGPLRIVALLDERPMRGATGVTRSVNWPALPACQPV